MWKKLLVILLLDSVLVYVVSLVIPGFNVGGNVGLTYDTLKSVIEAISGTSESFVFDMALIRTLQLYLTNFDFNATQEIVFTTSAVYPDPTLPSYEVVFTGIYIKTTAEDGETETIEVVSGLQLSDEYRSGLVSVLGWLDHEPCNGNILTTVFLVVKSFVGFLVAFCFILVYLVFDVIMLVWSFVLGMLRLFGWVS